VAVSQGDEPPDPVSPVTGEGESTGDDRVEAPSVTLSVPDGVVVDGVDTERLRLLASFVLRELDVPSSMAVDVLFVDVAAMTDLNVEHMGGDGPTDVLAFPIDAPDEVVDGVPAMLGDVVLCQEVAGRQARAAGKTLSAELDMLLVHGLLHLLGYDHQEPDERRVMFGLTDRLLEAFGGGAA
jgi:probable rRNA maturation factor